MYQLTIKNPNNLLSVVLQQEITPAQSSSIIALLAAPDVAYSEVLRFLNERIEPSDEDSVNGRFDDWGAGESVEAYRG